MRNHFKSTTISLKGSTLNKLYKKGQMKTRTCDELGGAY